MRNGANGVSPKQPRFSKKSRESSREKERIDTIHTSISIPFCIDLARITMKTATTTALLGLTLLLLFGMLQLAAAEPPETRLLGKNKGKKDKKGKEDKRSCKSHKKSNKKSMTAEAKCAVFKAFVSAEREMPTGGPDRMLNLKDGGVLCEAFDTVNPFVCPSSSRAAKICSEPRPEKNPAVKELYCEPMFRDMCDSEEREVCTRTCIQYVSQANGDCCGMECE
mmetsp:Transcript_19618/g.42745  ORF Transcript_19618/g.42745 Transcript_19618/m.42745 type:complete len:223 (-) Transcript_19618:250-918(-)